MQEVNKKVKYLLRHYSVEDIRTAYRINKQAAKERRCARKERMGQKEHRCGRCAYCLEATKAFEPTGICTCMYCHELSEAVFLLNYRPEGWESKMVYQYGGRSCDVFKSVDSEDARAFEGLKLSMKNRLDDEDY